MSVAALAFLASACRGSDAVEPQSPESGFSLEEFAGILSALPMDRSHLGEVFDAVCASSENGYDEEYMLADLVGSPGAGVGDGVVRSKAAPRYDRPLRNLLSDYFEANPSAVPTRAGSSEACLRMLEESDMQIYWPYSEAGWTFGVIKSPQQVDLYIFAKIITDMVKKMLFLWVRECGQEWSERPHATVQMQGLRTPF